MNQQFEQTFSIQFDNELPDLAVVAEKLDSYLDEVTVPEEYRFKIALIFEELATNIVKYAFPEGGRHSISLQVSRKEECLLMIFVDGGTPFNPLELPEPDLDAPLEERDIGGLGVFLVRSLARDVRYQRQSHQNILELDINLDQ